MQPELPAAPLPTFSSTATVGYVSGSLLHSLAIVAFPNRWCPCSPEDMVHVCANDARHKE